MQHGLRCLVLLEQHGLKCLVLLEQHGLKCLVLLEQHGLKCLVLLEQHGLKCLVLHARRDCRKYGFYQVVNALLMVQLTGRANLLFGTIDTPAC